MTRHFAILLAILAIGAHAFEKKDKVNIYVNKVSPWANPSESYRYIFQLSSPHSFDLLNQ